MDWDILWKAVSAAGLTGFLLVAIFGGGTDARAFWVYGWLYRQALKDVEAAKQETRDARSETRQWQRAFIRMAARADQAVNKTGEAINLAADLLQNSNRRGQDEDVDVSG